MLKLSEKDQEKLQKRIRTYKGQVQVLESAIGALVVGQFYGWRVLRMAHSVRAWNHYEKILGLKFKEVCPEYTELSERNIGVKMANKLGGFWKVFKGEVPVEGKANLT